jgi:hypothetical protein
MKIGTLRGFLCTLSIGVLLLLGMYVPAEAQRRNSSWDGRWRNRSYRNYGQQVSARRHYRNSLRRRLKRHQWEERRVFNTQRRLERDQYDNSREWRLRQRQQRAALRLHQRQESREFRQRWRNNRRWRQ